jgi:RNA polymerase sigma factor (sigma-70 family)
MNDDMVLVREFVASQSESAFAALVERHIGMVHSAALRHVGDSILAQDITQAVFIILARKAGTLGPDTILSTWLYRTTHHAAVDALKIQRRRQRREQEAYMQSALLNDDPNSAWKQLSPLLEEAMASLVESDRAALVLRYFEKKTGAEIALALKVSPEAAQKRVTRALERLRRYFAKRSVVVTGAAIAGALTAHSVQAAPIGLAAGIVGMALKGGSVSATVLALAKAVPNLMAWAKYKWLIGLGATALVAGGFLFSAMVNHWPSGTIIEKVAGTNQLKATGSGLAEAPDGTELREPLADGAFVSLSSPPGGLAVQPDGRIVVAASLFGYFTDPESGSLGYFRRAAFRLQPDGSLDRTFFSRVTLPGSSAMNAHTAVGADGRIFISGLFDAVDEKSRPGYAMLMSDGRVDEAFEPWRGRTNVPGRPYLPGGIVPAALLSDGTVAVMSAAVDGPRAPYPWTVHRLDATGAPVLPIPATSSNGEFSRPSGLVLTLGPVGFWTRKAIDWTRDTPSARRPPFQAGAPASDLPGKAPTADIPFERWTEPPSAVDAAVVFQALFEEVPIELCRYAVRLPDGGAILAIRDEVIDGAMKAHGRLMRFDRNWRPDFSFTNRYEADIRSSITLKMDGSGRFLVSGLIGTINGEDAAGVVRLEKNGSTDHTFKCKTARSLEGRVMDMAIQKDGRIVICGFFDRVNGVPRQHLTRVNSDGSLDETFKNRFIGLAELNTHRRFPVPHLSGTTNTPASNPATAQTGGVPSSETIQIRSMDYQEGLATILFSGRGGQSYVLQFKDALAEIEWTNLNTNQTDSAGGGRFIDADAGRHPMRWYRIAMP